MSLFLSLSFVYMCGACECEDICDHVQVRNGQSQPSGVFFWHSLALCPESGFGDQTRSLSPQLCRLAIGSWDLPVSTLQYWGVGADSHNLLFTWVLGIPIQFLVLAQKGLLPQDAKWKWKTTL